MNKGKYFNTFRIITIVAFLVTGLLVASPSVQAVAFETFDITSDHSTGTVWNTAVWHRDVGAELANVDVSVQLGPSYVFAKTGAVDFQAFIFNGMTSLMISLES
jgi:hypothetical protein